MLSNRKGGGSGPGFAEQGGVSNTFREILGHTFQRAPRNFRRQTFKTCKCFGCCHEEFWNDGTALSGRAGYGEQLSLDH